MQWLVRKVSMPVLAMLLCALAISVHAEDFGELEGSEHSPTFTAAERKHFIDAVSRFKKHEIPNEYFNGAPFWLDDEHLAFPSKKYPGWKAQDGEAPRIIVYNVVTGDIRDSGYRGRLRCLNHRGDFMLYLPSQPEAPSFEPEKYRWFIGRWGQSFQEIEYNPWARIPNYLCRYAPRGDRISQLPPVELPPDAAWFTPLLPEHGSLREMVFREGGELVEYLHLVDGNGSVTFIRKFRIRSFSLVFQPWSSTYFENGTTSHAPSTITPTGEYKTYGMPRLIRFWTSRQVARGGVFGCREGLLWTVQKSRGLWRKQGVYLDTGSSVIRVSEVSVTGGVITSPNGCRVFWGGFPGDSFESDKNRQTIMIDICGELSK